MILIYLASLRPSQIEAKGVSVVYNGPQNLNRLLRDTWRAKHPVRFSSDKGDPWERIISESSKQKLRLKWLRNRTQLLNWHQNTKSTVPYWPGGRRRHLKVFPISSQPLKRTGKKSRYTKPDRGFIQADRSTHRWEWLVKKKVERISSWQATPGWQKNILRSALAGSVSFFKFQKEPCITSPSL